MIRHVLEWTGPPGRLLAIEPKLADIVAAAPALAAGWNDSHNAAMMGHDEPFSEEEVVAHHEDLMAEGGRPFLLWRDGELVGDADLRGFDGGGAEMALMIAARAAQGRGLGTRFAVMVHMFGFLVLGLERIYVAVAPQNTASLRLFEKLGHHVDGGPAARAYADDPADVVLSVEVEALERAQPWLREIHVTVRLS